VLRVDVVTTFPDYLAPLGLSLVGRAREAGRLDLRVHDLRTWATDRHRSTDDAPYGGGAGMVMRPDVWGRAIDDVVAGADPAPLLLVPGPSGRRLDQAWAEQLSRERWLLVACGRFEGIDARVVEDAARRMPVAEVSLGDVVLIGGEVVALALVEAVVRLLPGVLGNPASLLEESHADGLLEYPVYTRPASWRGLDVPEVLQSGHHARIARWRRDESLRRTAARRPDLLRALPPGRLDAADRALLAALGWRPGADGRFGPPPGPLAD
jgi:tRNA (guanine37-N1)-methyltransferase